jgi:hypothetical protein
MKDCYCYLGLHFILLDDSSQSYILKLRDRSGVSRNSRFGTSEETGVGVPGMIGEAELEAKGC